MKYQTPQILCLGSKLCNKKIWELEDKADEKSFKKFIFQKIKNRTIKKRRITFKDQTKNKRIKFSIYEQGKIYFRIKQLRYTKHETAMEYTDSESVETAKDQLKENIKKAVKNLQQQLIVQIRNQFKQKFYYSIK